MARSTLSGQCRALQQTQKRLLDGMDSRLFTLVRPQDYVINWTRKADRRNVCCMRSVLLTMQLATCSACISNYDASLDSEIVEADAVAAGDYQAKAPFRRYARCWLRKTTWWPRAELPTEENGNARYAKRHRGSLATKRSSAMMLRFRNTG